MKRVFKQWKVIGLFFMLLAITVTGCSGKSKEEETEEEAVEEPAYPVTIDGAEIVVGETTVQTLLDKGLSITVSEMTEDNQINEYEIDPEVMLEANSYYSGATISITDSTFAHVAMVTDEEEVKMGEAVIAYMEFYLSSTDKTGLEKIAFNGVPVTEISREKAGEMFPDFTGDENMWLSPGTMLEYDYFMGFDTDGMLNRFSVKKEYDVDWNSES